jgi:hypothetical protein
MHVYYTNTIYIHTDRHVHIYKRMKYPYTYAIVLL